MDIEMNKYLIKNKYLVPFENNFSIDGSPSAPSDFDLSKKEYKKELGDLKDELRDLQDVLYAHNKYAVLCVFQALDAAGKDSTIRAVTTGINPAGFQVFSFKAPSKEELEHDFLWRTAKRLPERGRIGIFNRSYYEEVLVVKVHPQYLGGQNLPHYSNSKDFWEERYQSIRDHELHLTKSGIIVLKFWLNISKEEQKNRFIRRIDRPDKNWKFSAGDLEKRKYWDDYQEAFEDALNATSRPWAPWYAIPADSKPYMRLTVAKIIAAQLRKLDMKYPDLSEKEKSELITYKNELENE